MPYLGHQPSEHFLPYSPHPCSLSSSPSHRPLTAIHKSHSFPHRNIPSLTPFTIVPPLQHNFLLHSLLPPPAHIPFHTVTFLPSLPSPWSLITLTQTPQPPSSPSFPHSPHACSFTQHTLLHDPLTPPCLHSYRPRRSSPDAAPGGVVVQHVVPVPPQDEGLGLRHLADRTLELDGAARLVEFLAHGGAPLVDNVHHWGCHRVRGRKKLQ